MKIIFLALAGLSLATGTCVPPNTESNPVECLKTALEELSEFLPALAKFLCHYYGSIEYNEANYNAALRELIDILKCAGCSVDTLLGLEDGTVEHILQEGGEAVKELGKKVVLKLTDSLGLTEPVARLLCELLEHGLTSDCAAKLLAKLTPDVLKKIFCPESSGFTTGEIVDILKTAGCFADDLVGSGDEFETFTENLGLTIDDTMASLLKIILELTLPLNPLPCVEPESLDSRIRGTPKLSDAYLIAPNWLRAKSTINLDYQSLKLWKHAEE